MSTTVPNSTHERWKVIPEVTDGRLRQRVLLWVDAVGGYLVCLDDWVTIGQAVPDSPAQITLMGDLSRSHVQLRRQDDVYVLSPLADTRVAGRVVRGERLLVDGDELELGASVLIRFRQPHPLSSTARLELLSHHRCQPAVDGILLMAQAMVLGPAPSSHVVCRDWNSDVLVSRKSGDRWNCRHRHPLQIDGRAGGCQAEITTHSRVCGEDFCFSLEPLG